MAVDLGVAIRSRSISGFANCKVGSLGIRDWLRSGTFTFFEIDALSFELQRVTTSEVLPCMAKDFWRPCFAAIESISTKTDSAISGKGVAWKLIQQYYAAFFAAHSLMRISNAGVVRIEKSEAKYLSEVASIYQNRVTTVDAAQYKLFVDGIDKQECRLIFSRVDSSIQGDHQRFWSLFNKFLDDLAIDIVKQGDVAANDLIGRIDELTQILRAGGQSGGGWLSVMRNLINYQHSNGLWFPYTNYIKSDRYTASKHSSLNIRLDFDHLKKPVALFDATTMFLTLLCIEVANAITLKSKSRNSYSDRWAEIHAKWLKAC